VLGRDAHLGKPAAHELEGCRLLDPCDEAQALLLCRRRLQLRQQQLVHDGRVLLHRNTLLCHTLLRLALLLHGLCLDFECSGSGCGSSGATSDEDLVRHVISLVVACHEELDRY